MKPAGQNVKIYNQLEDIIIFILQQLTTYMKLIYCHLRKHETQRQDYEMC